MGARLMRPTRKMLEQKYEDTTGLDAQNGSARIDKLEAWIKEYDIRDFEISNNTDKMRRDFNRNGILWYPGTEHGDTICLGYTMHRRGLRIYKNAVFAQSDDIELGE